MRSFSLLLVGLLALTACSTSVPETTGGGLTDVVALLWNYGIEPVARPGTPR
jgi:hypothetical protein